MPTEKLSKKLQMINFKTILVTVDNGKYKNSGYARTVSDSELGSFEFANTGSGLRDFLIKRDSTYLCVNIL